MPDPVFNNSNKPSVEGCKNERVGVHGAETKRKARRHIVSDDASTIYEYTHKDQLDDYPAVLNFRQFCEILQIQREKGYKLLRNNEIHHRKCGRSYIVPKLALLDYINRHN